ncbi:MAG: hypothetical protein Q9183_006774, partial [Haloplaca sp. 2 TL-2023]
MSTPPPTLLDHTTTYLNHLLSTLRASLSRTTHTLIFITTLLALSLPHAYLAILLARNIYYPAMLDTTHKHTYLEIFLLSGGIMA